jgi:hypothetical protein
MLVILPRKIPLSTSLPWLMALVHNLTPMLPRFLAIGWSTRFGNFDYYGPVVASADAIFMFLESGSGHGLVAKLIDTVAQRLSAHPEAAYQCDLSELPIETVGNPDWPIRKTQGRIFVVPRQAVKSVNLGPWWHSLLHVRTEEVRFQIGVSIFKRREARRFLREMNWDLKG